MSRVIQPFASRPLAPWVARLLAGLFHTSIWSGFIIEGVVALFILSAAVGWILIRLGSDLPMLIAVGGTAFWAQSFNGVGLPDLSFAALLAILLLFLAQRRMLLAALMLFPLYVSRESTLLVVLCLLIAAWKELRIPGRLLALTASVAGILVTRASIPAGMQNKEHVNQLAYMAGKVPWNVLKNIVGVPPWSNVNFTDCASPRWRLPLHFGTMTTVGLCAFSPHFPVTTLWYALSAFGLLPLLLVFAWRHSPSTLRSQSVLLRFCLLYGIASFLLAPELGSSVLRLFYYAWPAFLIAVPLLLKDSGLHLPPNSLLTLVCLHIAVSWLLVIRPFTGFDFRYNLLALSLTCALYGVGWFILHQAFQDSSS